MKLAIDAVAFQPDGQPPHPHGAFWCSFIAALDDLDAIDIVLLDRGCAPGVDRGRVLPFPPRTIANAADDSIMLQRICDHVGADIFLSTGWTTPLRTPSMIVALDGEVPAPPRERQERDLALAFARRICPTTHEAARALPAELGWKMWDSGEDVASDAGVDQAGMVLLIADRAAGSETPWSGVRAHLNPAALLVLTEPAAALEQLARIDAGAGTMVIAVDDPGNAFFAEAYARGCLIAEHEPHAAAPTAGLRWRSIRSLAHTAVAMAETLVSEAEQGQYERFLYHWERIRRLQADVDVR